MTPLTAKLIRLDSIDIPEDYERKASLVEDDALRQSVDKSGVQQQASVVAKEDGRFDLIDGARLVSLAAAKGDHTIAAVVHQLPEGEDPETWKNRLRLVLNTLRQDLRPSQRASFIKQLMGRFGFTQKDVAGYLGVDAGTISGWLAIDAYAPEIVKAIDGGQMTLFAARSFDGMKPEAQPRVWRSMRKEFDRLPGGKLHKAVRAKFSPKSHPDFYIAPEKTIEKLARKAKGRKSRRRPRLTRDEKELLSRDLGLREVELADGKEELQRLKREITLATPPIRAIMRSKELREQLPEATREEFERFAEVYC